MDRRLVVVGVPLGVMAATFLLFCALSQLEHSRGGSAAPDAAAQAR
jgi:hypothetical protein